MELEALLKKSVIQKGSDLHLSPDLQPLLRVNGNLVRIQDELVLDSKAISRMVREIMTDDQQKLFDKNLELDFAVMVPDTASFRVNTFHQSRGVAAVFRVIPEKIPSFDELNFPDIFKELLELPNGLILVTGPTGSGKSTTLAAMIDYINEKQACHVITVEDPIEFTHQSKKSLINQRQVHRDTHDFTAALRSALREDPDVIMIGEMRDLETIRLALTAAETGHLVMATLHTSSAPRTITRIIDVFPESEKNIIRNMLSESLQGVICQTLVPAVAGGRIGALEIMLGSHAIRHLIREDKIVQIVTAMQTGSSQGMFVLDQYLQNLLSKQLITLDVAKAAAVRKEAIFVA